MEQKRVVIYCRVGNNKQAGALELQEYKLRSYAHAKGYKVVAVKTDIGTGLSLDRPGIKDIFNLAAQRAMDEVLAVKVCRLSRRQNDLITVLNTLRQHGVVAHTMDNALPDAQWLLK